MSEAHIPVDNVIENEQSLRELAWAIEMSQGQFSVMLARCNYVFFRDNLLQQLKTICSVEIREIILEPTVNKLYTTIIEKLADEQPSALMVLGLESVNNIDELLISMNQVREEFRKNCHFPIVLWINEEISRKLIRLAPDFQSWATLNEFVANLETLNSYMEQEISSLFTKILDLGNSQVSTNGRLLDFPEQLEIKAALKKIPNQIETLEPALQASLKFVLAENAYFQEKLDDALFYYEQSLIFWQQNNNHLRAGILQFKIGLCYYRRGYINPLESYNQWLNAQSYLQQCVDTFENINRLDLVANFIGQLAQVWRCLENWEKLAALAKKSQSLHETYGKVVQLAQDYGFLAEVALHKQDYQLARDMSLMALQTLETATPKEKQYYQGLYLLLLSRSYRQLGELESAVKASEAARNNDPQDNPELYIEILSELRSLYFQQHKYIEAFEIKQTQRSIEQQFGFRAFIGAGLLQPQLQVRSLVDTEHQETIAEEIVASGRQRDIEQLTARISSTQYNFTVIYGQSGVGKSSLITAGLVPALKLKPIGSRDVLPLLLRGYTNWMNEISQLLTESLNKKGIYLSNPLNSAEMIVEQLEKLEQNNQHNLLIVLIFDQFEEFFLVSSEPSQKQEFFDFLGDCLNISLIKVVVSMRKDYISNLLDYSHLPKIKLIANILSKEFIYPLGNFSPEDAKNFIIARSQFPLETDLVNEIVHDLAGNSHEVRPIELQIIGAQMQTDNINTLAKYRELGPKDKLVQRYLEEIIKDCGSENEEIAQIVLYLLTDENNTRPLKTQAELELILLLDFSIETNKLELVLKIFVKSGLVFLLREALANRYQLVHDYLVIFIRRQQSSQLIAKRKEDRKQREFYEKQSKVIEQANQILAETEERVKREPLKRRAWDNGMIALGGLTVAGFITILRILGMLQFWELGTFDWLVRMRPLESPDERIVIVGINEQDVKNAGRWPMSDSMLTKLIEKIKSQKAIAIGLDFYRDIPVEPGHSELVNLYQSTRNLIGIEKVSDESANSGVAPPPELSKRNQVGANNSVVDIDGKLRRGLFYIPKNGETMPSFSVKLAEIYLQAKQIESSQGSSPEIIQWGKGTFKPFKANDGGYIDADDGGYQILLNYRHPPNSYHQISMTDVLKNKSPENLFTGRIVLIGATADSLNDFFYTPYSSSEYYSKKSERLSGIEVQANIISQILSSALSGRPGINTLSKSMEVLLIWVWSALGTFLIWRWHLRRISFSLIILTSVGLFGSCYWAIVNGWWLPLIPPLLAFWGAATITRIIATNQLEKLRLRRTLELLRQAGDNNPEAVSRAIEYFFVAQGKVGGVEGQREERRLL